MSECRPSLEGSMALGLLELAPIPLSVDEFIRNFDLQAADVVPVLYELEEQGYVETLEGRMYYQLTDAGAQRVELRSAAAD